MADSGRVDPCVWRSSNAIRPNGPRQVSLGQRQVSTAPTHFALKGQRRRALRNPVRVHVQTEHQPGAAFIRIRGFSCPRLICASLSGSIAAPGSSINANAFSAKVSLRAVRMRPLCGVADPSTGRANDHRWSTGFGPIPLSCDCPGRQESQQPKGWTPTDCTPTDRRGLRPKSRKCMEFWRIPLQSTDS